MKVIWICHFSNSKIRKQLNFSMPFIEKVARKILRKPSSSSVDYSKWITNGIKEFEKFKDVELHVVSPHYGMRYRREEFEMNDIYYHFFKPDDNSYIKKQYNRFVNKEVVSYKGNRKIVKEIIDQVNPDIIHMYGAENPYYSISAIDIDTKKHPLIVSLQTLLSDKDFKANYPISEESYRFKSNIEQSILIKTKYIGSSAEKFRKIIWQSINTEAIFFNTFLAVGEVVKKCSCEKMYDFIYYSTNIAKAVDIAIEAFAIVCNKYPKLTLNIVGSKPEPFTRKLNFRIKELDIEKNVVFSGMLPTHEDVIRQVQLSKYALLPLKIDGVSGTIREAMFSGIPVVTTVTRTTPDLNLKRKSILISELGDYKAMAQNMINLIESPELAQILRDNGLITVNERWNNNKSMHQLLKAYNAIKDHHLYGKPIPAEIGSLNPKIKYV
jgi:glycosyltransferase involved in cell wall biosynthesis